LIINHPRQRQLQAQFARRLAQGLGSGGADALENAGSG